MSRAEAAAAERGGNAHHFAHRWGQGGKRMGGALI
jgi:hypothetical protein